MSTYAEVMARIEDDINRTDITSRVQEQIKKAIEHYKRFPMWFNEAQTTLTASSSTTFLTVPSDYIDTVELFINISGSPKRMTQKSLREIIDGRPTGGSTPYAYSYFGDRFELECPVNIQYTFPLWYIKELATLSASSDTSLWLSTGEDLIVARAEKVLYRDVLKDAKNFSLAKDAEREAKSNLLGFRDQKVGTGYAKPWGY